MPPPYLGDFGRKWKMAKAKRNIGQEILDCEQALKFDQDLGLTGVEV